ncbi:MAG: glutaredoxin domain-containing protein [Ruthenibacterium lactatiformans]
MVLVWYPKCSTCQRAKAWLDEHGVAYTLRDIKEENPNAEELRAWHEKAACPSGVFQHKRSAVQRHGAEGQAAWNDGQ